MHMQSLESTHHEQKLEIVYLLSFLSVHIQKLGMPAFFFLKAKFRTCVVK